MNVWENRRTWKDMAIYLLPLLHWNNLKSFYPLIFVDLGTYIHITHTQPTRSLILYATVSLSLSNCRRCALVLLSFLHFASKCGKAPMNDLQMCWAWWMEKRKFQPKEKKQMWNMDKQRNMNRIIYSLYGIHRLHFRCHGRKSYTADICTHTASECL